MSSQSIKGKNLYLSVFVFLIMLSCNQLTEKSKNEGVSEEISFSKTYTTFEEPNCVANNCATITITSVSLDQNHRINQFIEDKVLETLVPYIKSDGVKSLEKAQVEFFNDFKGFKQAFPESRTPWEIKIAAKIDWMAKSKGFLSLGIETYSYTGGAHANSYTAYYNLTDQGKLLKRKNWLRDKQKLLKVSEEIFREQKRIPASQSLADAGFDFEKDAFALPENIGFSNEKMLLHYNAYEISSYADGPTIIEIPFSRLEGIFKN